MSKIRTRANPDAIESRQPNYKRIAHIITQYNAEAAQAAEDCSDAMGVTPTSAASPAAASPLHRANSKRRGHRRFSLQKQWSTGPSASNSRKNVFAGSVGAPPLPPDRAADECCGCGALCCDAGVCASIAGVRCAAVACSVVHCCACCLCGDAITAGAPHRADRPDEDVQGRRGSGRCPRPCRRQAATAVHRCVACDDASWRMNMLQSRLYKSFVQFVALLHCMLAFWEYVPGCDGSPPFSWGVGLLELTALAVYVLDIVLRLCTLGPSIFWDKKWNVVFAAAALLACLDWALFYPLALHSVYRFAVPLRPMLFISKKSSHRRMLAAVLRTIPRIFDITVLLCVVLGFYAVLGMQLFTNTLVPEYNPAWDNFNSFGAGALAMFIVKSSENYPGIQNTAMDSRPVIALFFFISAVYVLFWFVVPLFLSVVYDFYQESHRAQASAKRLKSYPPLVLAFQILMQGDGDKEMDYDMFRAFLPHVSALYDTSAVARPVFTALDVDADGSITILEWLHLPVALKLGTVQASATFAEDSEDEDDSDSDEESDHEGAQRGGTKTQLQGPPAPPSRPPRPSAAPPSSERTVHFGQADSADGNTSAANSSLKAPLLSSAPAGSSSASASSSDLHGTSKRSLRRAVAAHMATSMPWYHKQVQCCSAVSRFTPYRWGVSKAAAVAVAVLATFWTERSMGQYRKCAMEGGGVGCVDWGHAWYPILSCMLMLLTVMDVFVRALGSKGGAAAWWHASRWHKLDAVLVVWTTTSELALLVCVVQGVKLSFNATQILQVARAARVLRFITVFRRFRQFLDSLGSVVVVTLRMTVIYIAITYTFAAIAFPLFQHIPADAGEATGVDDHREWDYSTFGTTWMVLLQITVGNNINDNIYTAVYGRSRWLALVFVAYYFLCATVLLEIVVGVTIELYCAAQEQRAVEEQNKAQAKAAKAEAKAARRHSISGGAAGYTAVGGGADPRPSFDSTSSHDFGGAGISGFKPLAVAQEASLLRDLATVAGGGVSTSSWVQGGGARPKHSLDRTRARTSGAPLTTMDTDLLSLNSTVGARSRGDPLLVGAVGGGRPPLLPSSPRGRDAPPPPPPHSAPSASSHSEGAAFTVDFVGALTGGSLLGASAEALHSVISPEELQLLEGALAQQERALLAHAPDSVQRRQRAAEPAALDVATGSFWGKMAAGSPKRSDSSVGTELPRAQQQQQQGGGVGGGGSSEDSGAASARGAHHVLWESGSDSD